MDRTDSTSGSGPVVAGAAHRRVVALTDRRATDLAAAGAYRALARQLDADLAGAEGGRCVLLTSVDRDHQPCDAATDLALTLADELGRSVLLVDAAFSGEGLTGRLGLAGDAGLAEALRGRAGADAPCATDHPRVRMLPVGRVGPEGVPLISTEVSAMLARWRREHEYVLVCADPLLRDNRGLVFPALADRVLLLAVEDRTRIDDLETCRRALESCKSAKIGVVLSRPKKRWFGF